jgi:predicted nucleotidyltransferase
MKAIKDIILKKFLKTSLPLLQTEFAPETIIVFGSRISGGQRAESDIDLIIISDYFQNISFVNRMAIVLKKLRPARHVDAICYTPEEFVQVKEYSSVVNSALREGVVINKGETKWKK